MSIQSETETTVEYVVVMPAESSNNQFEHVELPHNPGLGPNNFSSPHQEEESFWLYALYGL